MSERTVPRQPGPVRWWLVLLTLAATAITLGVALRRIQVDSDLTATIPGGVAELDASRRLLSRHPIVDRVAIDLRVQDGSAEPSRLIAAADLVKQRLESSGRFASVGHDAAAGAMAALYPSLVSHLPALLDARDLEHEVLPRLTEQRVDAALRQNVEDLAELGGVGQADIIATDPLRLRSIVLGRLERLAPVAGVRIEGNHVISGDGRHLLLTALPLRSAGDPASARQLEQLFLEIDSELAEVARQNDRAPIVMTVAGAYRAAADNERILRGDVSRAVWLVSIGVVVLLLVGFRRPLLGLLALLPALAGVTAALLVFALFSPKLSVLALGFGAALVSITVDHGIVFVSFMDRFPGLTGRAASRQVLPATSLATLTTMAAFLALQLSGYPLLEQLGVFAALGVACSFAFVHLVFPALFRRSLDTNRRALLPLDRWLRRLTQGSRVALLAVPVVLVLALGPLAQPQFRADLHALSTVSPETQAAEHQLRQIWGDMFDSVHVFLEADSVAELQARADRLAEFLAEQEAGGRVQSGWSPSLLFPGPELVARNVESWKQFWGSTRRHALRSGLAAAGSELDFTDEAFEPFLRLVDEPPAQPLAIPPEAHSLLGIQRARDGRGWVWLGALQRGSAYDASAFFEQAAERGFVVFDGRHFGAVLGRFLQDAFVRMMLITGAFVILSVVIAFWEWRLIAITLSPVAFGLLCTLGALGWLDRPIDIPALLLAIVVFGMGIDFSIHFMRGLQHDPRPDAAAHDSVRMAVLLASGSTLVGMLSLALAQHAALRSAGFAGMLGIGFCALGAFSILPALQRAVFSRPPDWARNVPTNRAQIGRAVSRRYRCLEPSVRVYAWVKLRTDPMFGRLRELVGPARALLDVGSGRAVPATWLLAQLPELRVVGIEPDAERARVAEWALGSRGQVLVAAAPDLPATDLPFDTALLLDVAHYLSDPALQATLLQIHHRLRPGGRLVLRDTVPAGERPSRERRIEQWLLRRRGLDPVFRSRASITEALERAGFSVQIEAIPDREETWFIGQRCEAAPGVTPDRGGAH